MPIHVDAPVPGIAFDPANFQVRGWLWLQEQHENIARVEAHDGDILLGTIDGASLHERADVNAKFGLPSGTRTGFVFAARHPRAARGQPFELWIRARLRDGSVTPTLFARLLAMPPLERHPFEMLRARLSAHALGLEIGAHVNPVEGLQPFYTDAVADFTGTAGQVDFLSDARALPLPDASLDYLCSSHVLEHLPNPVAALHEWHRVLRPGGLLYLVVPDKRYTFDAPRGVTPVAHMLRDFAEGTTAADDAAHVDEFVFQTDWSMLKVNPPPGEPGQQREAVRSHYLRELAHGRPIDIHYHTFTPDSLAELLQAAGFVGGDLARFDVLARAERYPPGRDDGIALLLARSDPPAGSSSRRDTYTLAPKSPGIPALPLVCPMTLSPLTEEASAGHRALIAAAGGQRYDFGPHGPALLPPPEHAPVRPWSDRSWRATSHRARSASAVVASTLRSHLDDPVPNTLVDPLCFFVRGWLWLGEVQNSIVAVEAWADDAKVGETLLRYDRPDVAAAHRLDPEARTGFELYAHHAGVVPGQRFELEIRARLTDGSIVPGIFRSAVTPIRRDYRTNHFGVLLDQRTTALQRHDNVFATGPSQAEGSAEVAYMLRRYFGPPPKRILDVGCGLGSYGRGLLADGYGWVGAEVSATDCAELARLGLPHRQIDGRTLPFQDAEFDAAMCIEVLEHVAEPHAFLAEVSRVAPRQLIVSVPNCELLGYLYDHLAAPWHMLEASHVNFFTRWSLAALLRQFYANVELRFHTPYPLRTIEGTPLHYNLLAIASSPS